MAREAAGKGRRTGRTRRGAMREVLPGVHHWTVLHEKIRIPVHSYYLEAPRVLIDPMEPPEGLEWFRRRGEPRHILLTNRHHYRHSSRFVEAFGTDVRCHRAGLHEFTHGETVAPFDHGDELPGGIRALEVGVLCPEETALLHAGDAGGVLALGDAVIRDADGELGFVPDEFMGEDPEAVKRGLREVFRRVSAEDFDHLLLAHGEPLIGTGRDELRAFAG